MTEIEIRERDCILFNTGKFDNRKQSRAEAIIQLNREQAARNKANAEAKLCNSSPTPVEIKDDTL